MWLYNETLTLEFASTPLSQFHVSYQPDKKHLRQVTEPHRFQTQYRSPQLELWGPDAVEWHLIRRLPAYFPRVHRELEVPALVQAPPFSPVREA
jgi:hypothetical protein